MKRSNANAVHARDMNRTVKAGVLFHSMQNAASTSSSTTASKKQQSDPPATTTSSTAAHAATSPSHGGFGDTIDQELVHKALADAGRWAYGIVMAEVWVMNSERTTLVRHPLGWWMDPVFHRGGGNGGGARMGAAEQTCQDNECSICRLFYESRSDYLPPGPLIPGEGLPGALWSNIGGGSGGALNYSASRSLRGSARRGLLVRTLTSRNIFSGGEEDGTAAATSPGQHHHQQHQHCLVWRNVPALARDPDQPWSPRLQLLASIGLGWAAAVPFELPQQQERGMVVYIARASVQTHKLKVAANENYLVAATHLIGAAYALREPRRQMVEERRAELTESFRRVRAKILAARSMGLSLRELIAKEEQIAAVETETAPAFEFNTRSILMDYMSYIRVKVLSTAKKCRGGGVLPPPTFTWIETTWTFVGCFITLLMVTRLSVYLVKQYGSNYAIVLGPFGAFVTLLYGLTAAPASQPRNAILGQSISMTIALGISYADGLEIWMKQSLATALAVAAMVKLGITHPPAGAAAMLLAGGDKTWGNFAFTLVGNVIAIGAATVINNLSDKRQYPSFWGVAKVIQILKTSKSEP